MSVLFRFWLSLLLLYKVGLLLRNSGQITYNHNQKLRQTTSHFLVAYFFPGCDDLDSELPTKMVRDGYSTSFRCDNIAHLEKSIIDCFTETGR